jgi:hypothetical protein
MGIFNFFTNKNKLSSPQTTEQKDDRKAECPSCYKALAKIPGRKTQCSHCGEFMFVRTRPKDNTRVVVTKDEADKIDEDWSIVSGTHDSFVAQKMAMVEETERLREAFGGKEPSENDVKWSLLNKELLEHANHGNWGLYRNTRFQMAELLRQEVKLKQALQTYLEVCYLDLNGPNNSGGFFDPRNGNAFLAPGVIRLVQRTIKKLGTSKEDVRKEFIEYNTRIEKSLQLPVTPVASWDKIESEVW